MGRRVSFYTDEHVAKAVVRGLRQRGVDVLIVYAPQHTPVGEIIRGLMLIHQILEAEEIKGIVEFL